MSCVEAMTKQLRFAWWTDKRHDVRKERDREGDRSEGENRLSLRGNSADKFNVL